jgi:serine/threonine-protein kinase HipA
MARDAGIEMAPCRLLEAGDGRHFMTRRFDRTGRGRKLHMQSLAALCHFDFNDSGGYSYEQAVQAIRRVSSAAQADCEQLFLRAVFNVATCNQDDHAKNIAFLMWPNGQWRLSPAFDLTYAHNSTCVGAGGHQMSVNGKRDNISHDDLLALSRVGGVKPARAKALIKRVLECVRRWLEFTDLAQVPLEISAPLAHLHRLHLL